MILTIRQGKNKKSLKVSILTARGYENKYEIRADHMYEDFAKIVDHYNNDLGEEVLFEVD